MDSQEPPQPGALATRQTVGVAHWSEQNWSIPGTASRAHAPVSTKGLYWARYEGHVPVLLSTDELTAVTVRAHDLDRCSEPDPLLRGKGSFYFGLNERFREIEGLFPRSPGW